MWPALFLVVYFMANKQRPILFVFGPTAVGKTDFVDKLALHAPIEIINMDSSQCYTPLTIGTAKPDWRSSTVPSHLFDILDQPIHQTVVAYRALALEAINSAWQHNKIPVFVGGSGFYLASLLYPPVSETTDITKTMDVVGSWEELNVIDSERAQLIHHNDHYRINRALNIWHQTGVKPSQYEPPFNPPGDCTLLFLTRERSELKERIEQRVHAMMQQGFIDEVHSLTPAWKAFVREKKIIGYADVIAYLEGEPIEQEYHDMIAAIVQKTTQYAKKQETFWRSLTKKIAKNGPEANSYQQVKSDLINLTLSEVDLYIKQLLDSLLNTVN